MSYAKQKGSAMEQWTADFLAAGLDDDRIERRVKRGVKDRGDISGLRFFGRRGVIEVKNTSRLALAEWVKEAEIEAGNDDADFWAVVHKRRGFGQQNMGGQYVTMTLEQFVFLMRAGQ